MNHVADGGSGGGGSTFSHGADPEVMDRVAQDLTREARALNGVRRDAGAAIRRLDAGWSGADQQGFRRTWGPTEEDLREWVKRLEELARRVREQAEQQRRTSTPHATGADPGGPATPWLPSPFGDGPQTDGPPIWHVGKDQPWVPQGLAYDPATGLLLTSYYDKDDTDHGLLSLQDKETGVEVNNVLLLGNGEGEPPNHSGGVAIHGDHVWVTSTRGEGDDQVSEIYQYSLSDMLTAEPGQGVTPVGDPVEVSASSTATYGDGQLWVASFHENDPGTLYSYDVNPDGSLSEAPTSSRAIPEKIQGVAVDHDSIYLSQSFGRGNESHIYSTPREPMIPWAPGWPREEVTTHNMSEGIALDGDGGLLTVNESGASKYDDGDDDNDPRDVLTNIPVR